MHPRFCYVQLMPPKCSSSTSIRFVIHLKSNDPMAPRRLRVRMMMVVVCSDFVVDIMCLTFRNRCWETKSFDQAFRALFLQHFCLFFVSYFQHIFNKLVETTSIICVSNGNATSCAALASAACRQNMLNFRHLARQVMLKLECIP